jgi:PKD repeat protein
MGKTTTIAIVGLFVISGFVGIFSMVPDEVEATGPTYVSGVISEDTVWTIDDSPYIIIDNTTLNTGVTLTIEAGTVIKFKDNTCFAIRGKLHVKGNNMNRVVFTNEDPLVDYYIEYQIRDGLYHDETYYNGSGIDYYVIIDTSNGGEANISFAKFEYSSRSYTLKLCDNEDKIPENMVTDTIFNNNRGGISGAQSWIVKRCTFENNWNGIYSKGVDIYDCIFRNNTFGEYDGDGYYYNCSFTENIYGIYSDEGSHAKFSTFSNNKVGMCGQIGALNNKITNNKFGIISYHGSFYGIEYNNIHSNIDYKLKLYGSENRNIPHNWWGTTDTTVIDQYIYDIYDDSNLGEAIYKPFLEIPVNITPQPPVAKAGLDQNVFINQNVHFNGSGSYDSEGYQLTYKWDFGDGTFKNWDYYCNTSHSYSQQGSYTVTLTVSDGELEDTDTCIINVSPEDDDYLDVTGLLIFILIVFIIIVVLGLFLTRKRGKKPQENLDADISTIEETKDENP